MGSTCGTVGSLAMIIVTSYDSPDLDGIACSIAYTELLRNLGREVKTTYYGDLGLEVDFVKKFTNYFPIERHKGAYRSDAQFVLVDTADPDALDPAIQPEKVIEVYDHRQLVFMEKFVNSKKKIELVGSCATLIAEEFQKNNLAPSVNAAIYLYSAIVSNTINFKNSITTKRDIVAAKWLKGFVSLPADYIKQMFSSKSLVTADNLYQILYQDFAIKVFDGKKVGIAQIEIINLETTLRKLKDELRNSLIRLREEHDLDYAFFTGIDLLEGFNIFYTIDSGSNSLFSKVLGIPELKAVYKSNAIIMRKEIWPKVEAALRIPTKT